MKAQKKSVNDEMRHALARIRDECDSAIMEAESLLERITLRTPEDESNDSIPVELTQYELVDLLAEIKSSPQMMGIIQKLSDARWGH